jgi:hypothetical protein
VLLSALLVGQDVAGWIVGLVIAVTLCDPASAVLVIAAAVVAASWAHPRLRQLRKG